MRLSCCMPLLEMNNSTSFILLGCIGVVLVVVLYIALRNSLIRSKNLVVSAYADVDAQLLLRYELIPKLVRITEHYMQHETALLVKIVEERTREDSKSADEYSQILNKISVIKENYPELKADSSFDQLMTQIKKVEDHLISARRFYNGVVEVYNSKIAQFPYSIISGASGFHKQPYISAD